MKWTLAIFAACLLFSGAAAAQKTITAPKAVFPAGARDPIYGDSVRVMVQVNKKGVVVRAIAYGPLIPCSNLKDPVAQKIKEAAIKTAKDTVFEPPLKDGKPAEAILDITYRLRPVETMAPGPGDPGRMKNVITLSMPKPDYPERGRSAWLGGTIEIDILIGEDGRVISAGTRSGHMDLIDAGIAPACRAKFTPTTVGGQPVKVMGIITYKFVPRP